MKVTGYIESVLLVTGCKYVHLSTCLLKLYIAFEKLSLKSLTWYWFLTPLVCVCVCVCCCCCYIPLLSSSPRVRKWETLNQGILGTTSIWK